MTNEEAKKMLKAKLKCFKNETSGTDIDCNCRNCDECSLNYEQGNMGEQKEALDMAIQALEQQPCEDCISREALLKNLEEPMNWTDSEAEIQEQRDYEGFIELVKSMPSVTPSIEDWLSSFNTESATCCFTAVQELKKRLEYYGIQDTITIIEKNPE